MLCRGSELPSTAVGVAHWSYSCTTDVNSLAGLPDGICCDSREHVEDERKLGGALVTVGAVLTNAADIRIRWANPTHEGTAAGSPRG